MNQEEYLKAFFDSIFDSKPSPYAHIQEYVDDLSRDEQEYLYHLVKGRLDYFGATWSRETVDDYVGRPVTDEEWEQIKDTPEFDSLNEPSDADLYALQEAVDSVIADKVEQ